MKRKERTKADRVDLIDRAKAMYDELVAAGQAKWHDLPNGKRTLIMKSLPEDPEEAMKVFKEWFTIHAKHGFADKDEDDLFIPTKDFN